MDVATATNGVLQERNCLESPEAVSSPTYISEHMQRLAQYVSVLEEHLADLESKLEVRSAQLFKQYAGEGKSVNAAQVKMGYDVAEEKAQITRLTRLASSSWKLIGVSQSRIRHLLAEAQNQI